MQSWRVGSPCGSRPFASAQVGSGVGLAKEEGLEKYEVTGGGVGVGEREKEKKRNEALIEDVEPRRRGPIVFVEHGWVG